MMTEEQATTSGTPAKETQTTQEPTTEAQPSPTETPSEGVSVSQVADEAQDLAGRSLRLAGHAAELAGPPMVAVRGVLDKGKGAPVYVGAGALAVVGAIGWPVAAGVGLGYAALRRWGGQLPPPLRSLTGSRAQS